MQVRGSNEQLAKQGFASVHGARPLKRPIQRRIQDPPAMQVLQGQIHDGAQVHVDAVAGDITFHATCPEPQAEPAPVPEPVGQERDIRSGRLR